MMKVEFCIELKEGYKKTTELEPTKDMTITIEADNYVTAQRMFKAVVDTDKIERYISYGVN